MEFEFEKNLIVSTAHITLGDSRKLNEVVDDNEFSVCLVEKYDYGWSIMIQNPMNFESIAHKYSAGFLALITLAVAQDCQGLKIDRDGPVYENFLTYDW